MPSPLPPSQRLPAAEQEDDACAATRGSALPVVRGRFCRKGNKTPQTKLRFHTKTQISYLKAHAAHQSPPLQPRKKQKVTRSDTKRAISDRPQFCRFGKRGKILYLCTVKRTEAASFLPSFFAVLTISVLRGQKVYIPELRDVHPGATAPSPVKTRPVLGGRECLSAVFAPFRGARNCFLGTTVIVKIHNSSVALLNFISTIPKTIPKRDAGKQDFRAGNRLFRAKNRLLCAGNKFASRRKHVSQPSKRRAARPQRECRPALYMYGKADTLRPV